MKALKARWDRCLAPPPSDYAAAGDLLRVFCIFMVAWYHIWQQSWLTPLIRLGPFQLDMSGPVRTGYMFVDLILMLSGFLLYLPYANGRERSSGEFYLRRALRILPSYWLCLAVMLVFAVLEPNFTDGFRLFQDLLAHLGFVHNLYGFSYNATRLNVVLWTLAVEVQFYLILPALAPAFRRRPIVAYLAMTGAGLSFMFIWTMPMQDTALFVNRLPNMLVVYANGMLAAHAYARLARIGRRRALMALAGLALAAAAVWGLFRVLDRQMRVSDYDALRQGQLKWRWLFSACGAAFMLGGSLTFAPLRWAMSNRLVRFLSGVSFNFYIWHQWLAVKLKQWRIPPYLARENPNMAGEMPWQRNYTLLCFLAALLLAILLTFLVERPCARLGRRLYERVRAGVRGLFGPDDAPDDDALDDVPDDDGPDDDALDDAPDDDGPDVVETLETNEAT